MPCINKKALSLLVAAEALDGLYYTAQKCWGAGVTEALMH